VNVSEYIVKSLANQGIKDIFLLPGGGCMYLVDAVARSKELIAHPMLHEQSVGIAAEAYAQYSNSLGVALVTTGPGATNAITPCAAAWTDSTPVIFISGQVKTQDLREKYGVRQLGFQEVPITEIVAPITKMAIRIGSAEEISDALMKLLRVAQSDRPGPVWLDVPLDIQASETLEEPLQLIPVDRFSTAQDCDLLDKMLSAWNEALRPILILGNGVRISGSVEMVQSLLQRTNTPALLSWKALDFLSDEDPLNAGRPGAIAQRWSNFAQQTADFVLVLGARLDLGQTAYRPENFAPNAKKFIVDIDAPELDKLKVTGATLIHSDIKPIVQVFLDKISSGSLRPKNREWINRIRSWKESYPLLQVKHLNPSSGVNLYEFIEELSRQMTSDDLLVPGSSGSCSEIAMQAFKVKLGQRVLNSEGLGPMGFGISAPIGACLASGGKRTISIDGDGGFLMNVQELATLKYADLPVKIFILNNDGYGSIKSSQDRYFEGRRLGTDKTSGLGLPDLERMIRGFEINFFQLATREELSLIIKQALSTQGPVVIEIKVDPDQTTEPRTFTEIDSNGLFVTSPMEKLTPLLSDEELSNALFFD
jgi:acetolactate synthase-1/2/3 large subunit